MSCLDRKPIAIEVALLYPSEWLEDAFCCSSQTLANARMKGGLTGIQVGGHWHYRGADIVEWLDDLAVASEASHES